MKKSATPKSARKPRSDAQRNRERILEVAKQVFTRRGADASMGEIARRSKIGPGTLYRHFATRDDLLATVYIHDQVVEGLHRHVAPQPLDPWRIAVALCPYLVLAGTTQLV